MCFIGSHEMYAKAGFNFEGTGALCPFLQKMDEEETKVQKREEAAIVQEMSKETKNGSLLYGALVGGTGLFFAAMIISEAIITGLVLGILSVLGGALTTGIGMMTGCFGQAKPIAMDRLRINCHRAGRLYRKTKELAQEILLHKDSKESLQLAKARFYFKERLQEYKIGSPRDDSARKPAQQEQKS